MSSWSGEVASRQHGLVSFQQLKSGGYSRGRLRSAVARGELVEVRRHVYAVRGAPRSFEQTVLAAVLAAGKTAFASHETAAQLWRLPLPRPAKLEVTVVLERSAEISEAIVHRSGRLLDVDVRQVGAIPVSSPERTVFDLSGRFGTRALGRLVDEALRRHLTTLARIDALLGRLRPAPGRSCSTVRRVLSQRVPGAEDCDSALEDFVVAALRRYGLPLPVSQFEVRAGGTIRYLDLAYPLARVVLDVLGFEYHGGRARFDDDARRRNDLRRIGWDVREITSAFTDLRIAQEAAAALRLRAPSPSARAISFDEWRRLR